MNTKDKLAKYLARNLGASVGHEDEPELIWKGETVFYLDQLAEDILALIENPDKVQRKERADRKKFLNSQAAQMREWAKILTAAQPKKPKSKGGLNG